MIRRKFKTRKLTATQIAKIEDKLEKCLEYIAENEIYLTKTPRYQEELQKSLNHRGFSLVKTTNLADWNIVAEFCEANNLELISNM